MNENVDMGIMEGVSYIILIWFRTFYMTTYFVPVMEYDSLVMLTHIFTFLSYSLVVNWVYRSCDGTLNRIGCLGRFNHFSYAKKKFELFGIV